MNKPPGFSFIYSLLTLFNVEKTIVATINLHQQKMMMMITIIIIIIIIIIIVINNRSRKKCSVVKEGLIKFIIFAKI